MVKNKNLAIKKTSTGKIDSNFSLILKNTGIQTVIFLIFCFFAFVTGIKTADYRWMTLVALIIGSAFSGFISGRTKRRKGLICGILFALPFNLIVFIVSLFINSFSFDYMFPLCFFATVVSSSIGGMLSVNVKRKVRVNR